MAVQDNYKQPFTVDVTNYRRWPCYFDAHYHNGYELYFLLSGSVTYFIDKDVYQISEGSIVWIPPNIPHFTRPHLYESHNRILFSILPEYFGSCLTSDKGFLRDFFSCTRILQPHAEDAKVCKKLINYILEEYYSERPLKLLAIEGLLSSVLVCLLRSYQTNRTGCENASPNMKYELKQILSYINKNFHSNLTLSQIAEQVYLSPNYVSSLFSKNMHCTFKDYLTNVRITKASELLRSTDLNITCISEKCGFNSLNHFCKTFKKIVGLSPKAYRGTMK